jgi:hypothetical protein
LLKKGFRSTKENSVVTQESEVRIQESAENLYQWYFNMVLLLNSDSCILNSQ